VIVRAVVILVGFGLDVWLMSVIYKRYGGGK